MPRGICDNCRRHEMFVHSAQCAVGLIAFVCVYCLPREWDETGRPRHK